MPIVSSYLFVTIKSVILSLFKSLLSIDSGFLPDEYSLNELKFNISHLIDEIKFEVVVVNSIGFIKEYYYYY